MNLAQIDYLLFGNLFGMPVVGLLGGLFAAIAYRLLNPEIRGTKSVSDAIASSIKRIFLGAAVVFAFLVLSILSAIPYGGGSHGLIFGFRVALVLAPFWAALAVVDIRTTPAKNEAVRDESVASSSGKWKTLIGVILACFSAGIVLKTMVVKPPPSSEDTERETRYKQRELAIAQCTSEIQNVSDEYNIGSLLLDANVVDQFTLKYLLGDRGVRSVELRADRLKGRNNERDAWGVVAVSGDNSSRLEVDADSQYVRFDLAKKGDPLCSTSYGFSVGGNGPDSPFAPNTCLRATPDKKSLASHAIKALPTNDGTKFIRWSLVEQSTGNVLVALTSSDSPNSPVRQRGGSKNEWKIAKFGEISCRQPYFTLTNALRGVPQNSRQSLSLVRRKIEPKIVDLSSDAITWSEIRVDEIEAPEAGKTGAERTSPWGKDWEIAYRKAEVDGFADVGGELIDYKAGELLSLGHLKYEDKWVQPPHVGASPHGFAFVFGRPDGMRLVRYGFDGELQWQGKIQVNGRDNSVPAWPEIMGVKWADSELRIYVFRRSGQAVSHWLIRIPNSIIGVGK